MSQFSSAEPCICICIYVHPSIPSGYPLPLLLGFETFTSTTLHHLRVTFLFSQLRRPPFVQLIPLSGPHHASECCSFSRWSDKPRREIPHGRDRSILRLRQRPRLDNSALSNISLAPEDHLPALPPRRPDHADGLLPPTLTITIHCCCCRHWVLHLVDIHLQAGKRKCR